MDGERVYFDHGGQAGGAQTPSELAARNFYELRQLRVALDVHSIDAERVVEVGCGYGRLTPWLAEFTGASTAIGVDHDERSIELARTQYPSQRFDWRQGGAENIVEHVPENSVDVALTWTVLQHLSPSLMERTAGGIGRILSDGGWLIMAEETAEDEADHVWGRAPSEYEKYFSDLELVATEDRQLEPTFGEYSEGGKIMLLKKR
jgi:SAM-dependent methyltransferase